jgi:L-rhamnose-H+ transport protein
MEVINGILYHAVGASGAALCYTPQKKVKGWSWQTYWLAQAFICWLVLPVLVAYLTVPQLYQVLATAPASAMQNSFVLGMAYGIGGTAFGIAIRYVGLSLTYAVSVGISCVVGTLLPPLFHGTLDDVLNSNGAAFIMSGVGLGAAGIVLCGIAGRNKEIDIDRLQQQASPADQMATKGFSLAKGLPLCILAGLLSALYGFSLDQGQPIAEIAAGYGAGDFRGNVVYIFSNSGAFLTTLLYCMYLHRKEKTFSQYTSASFYLGKNYGMALLTGLLWYGQFFFYGLGHVRMGNYQFSSWAIHMILLVMLSAVAGLFMKEWKNCRPKTWRLLFSALTVLIVAVVMLTYGNYLGQD